uniref:Pumilio domain-containing protein C14orf21 n=1 Tax=Lygus hesperus TaxID=30085 RepID=A0A146M932_LYGHE
MGESEINRRGKKRKIKNNKFISRAKKKMKEGRFDILDAETYEYFLRIGESLRSMTADEDKTDFCSNVLKETAGKEWDVMRHAMSSRILEAVIPVAPWADMEGIREAARDRRSWEGMGCPARVLECLLKDSARRINEDASEKVECIKFLETKSRLFLNNLESQIWETNANHVTRCCLTCCSESSENKLHEVVKEATLYVMGWGQLNDHFSNPLISGFLQILLSSARKCCPKTCDKLLKHLNKVAFLPKSAPAEEGGLPRIFLDEPLLRLLESAVTESSEKMFLKLFNNFFKDRLLPLALSDSHFALNKLILACSDKFIFEEIYAVLMESMDELAAKGRFKILTALSDRCLALTTKQGDFIQKIKVWLGCDQKEDKFTQCLLRMTKLSELNENSKIDMNGSLVLQNMFKFNKPIKVVESFLSSDPSELRAVAEDTKGSWVFNSFLTSSSVGDKSRMRLLAKMRGSYLPLASTKFGSRVFEELWKSAKFKDRQQMISELDRSLLSSQSGRVVAKKIQLELYLTDKKSWTSKHSNVKHFID